MSELTDHDRAVLDFEGRWWKYQGAKEAAIASELGLGATRYYQQLAALVARPEAVEYAPIVCNRVRRQVIERQRARDPHRVGLT